MGEHLGRVWSNPYGPRAWSRRGGTWRGHWRCWEGRLKLIRYFRAIIAEDCNGNSHAVSFCWLPVKERPRMFRGASTLRDIGRDHEAPLPQLRQELIASNMCRFGAYPPPTC